MRFPALLVFLLSAAVVPLHAQRSTPLSAPEVGNVRYTDGSVRAVYGFDANFVLGPVWAKASAAAFSNEGGLLAEHGAIELLRPDGSIAASYATHESHPLLGIDGGPNTAVGWLPSPGTLVWWDGSALRSTPLAGSLPGTATSVQSDGTTATMLVTAEGGTVLRVVVALASGDIVSSDVVPGARGPAFLQGPFVVFRNEQGLAIEAPNGDLRTLEFPASDLQIERMSSNWLHVYSTAMHRDWALHLSRSVCRLSQLPEMGK